MAALAFGLVGGFFFGPIGFLIGSMIGNLLFPAKQDGPKLTDLHVQGSEYGKMIPLLYGTDRLAGQIVWATDLVPHKHTTSGKGGPQIGSYSYTVSFAVKICKGPASGFQRIWANGTLIYDTTGQTTVDNSKVPVTFYLGVETAEPDPTMEAALGVGNVPAFRDDVAAVFTDWDVSQYGNMIPNLTFQLFTDGGPIPWRVESFTPANNNTAAIVDGELQISTWTAGPTYPANVVFQLGHYQLDGTLITLDDPILGPNPPSTEEGTTARVYYCANNPHIAFARMLNADLTQNAAFYYDGAITVSLLDFTAAIGVSGGMLAYHYANDSVYCVGGDSGATLKRYSANLGRVEGSTPSASYALPVGSSSEWIVTIDTATGHVWAATGNSVSTQPFTLCYEFDEDLNVLNSWDTTQTPGGFVPFNNGFTCFTVFNGRVCWTDATSDGCVVSDPGTPWTEVGRMPMASGGSNMIPLGNGLVAISDGIASLNPQPSGVSLASIVADLSERAGLDVTEYDVTDLELINVPGYLVTTRADCKADILPLQTAYFFDAVESSGVMKFVLRGGPTLVTIPDDDLAAQVPGAEAPAIIEVKRVEDLALPAEVDVTYANLAAAYQPGTQRATRQVTNSQAVADLQLAIAMTDADAARIAKINLYESVYGRSSFIIRVPRKYLYVEPTDVISAGGYLFRVIRKQDKVDGTIELEGVRTLASMYTTGVAGNPTSGGISPTPSTSQATALLLMDIPLIADTDDPNGFYEGMAGVVDATWRGGTLNKSTDGGTSYTAVATDVIAATMGVTSNALGNWTGGNEFDESNRVTLVVGPGGGTLSSADALAVYNGANTVLVGNEVLQFKVADLTAPSTYQISGLLRGRRGTEWTMGAHVAGERFCLLPATDVSASPSELGQSRLYKPVTIGQTLASAIAYPFTNNGAALRPYSPVGVFGGIVSPFDGTVQINWTRRTRIGGAWVDFVDVPLSEPVEKYVVQIWDSTYTNVARIIEVTSPTATYTAAQQTTDFGATQQHVYVTVGQVGAYTLGTQTAAVIPGSGASDGSVITPIPPYNGGPPPPTGGCTLPTTINDFVWSAPVSQYNPGAGPTGTWVLRFTTGSITAGAGSIQAAEYAGPPTDRDAVLALSPCGAPLTPASHQTGNTVAVIFYMQDNPHPTIYPTLLPSTTYYFSINSLAPSGMICNLSTPH